MRDIIIQGIGFIGVFFFIISYQFKSNKLLLMCQFAGSSMFCLQFLLLGAFGGAANLVIGLLRNILILARKRHPSLGSPLICAGLVGASLISMVLTWSGPLSLLPCAAMVSANIGYWDSNAQKIRLVNLAVASPCWLVYDILVGSWGGVANEVITTVSALVSIGRYGWKALAAVRE